MRNLLLSLLLVLLGCGRSPALNGAEPNGVESLRPPPTPIAVLTPCGPCAGWWDWGHRLTVCSSPSEGLLQAEVDCLCSGAGAGSCTAWCAGYEACQASGDPACVIADDPICDAAMSLGGACHTEAFACGADHTGCVSCSAWLDGGDPEWLCPSTGGPPDSIDPAITLSDCACSGGCSSKCSGACGLGYFDPTAASFKCGTCLAGGACSAAYATCSSN